jgi:hypothetical protein
MSRWRKLFCRHAMYLTAKKNRLEDITRLLDEGVDPAAYEERSGVRLMMCRCVGWIGGRVSLPRVLTVCIAALQAYSSPRSRFHGTRLYDTVTVGSGATTARPDRQGEWEDGVACVCVMWVQDGSTPMHMAAYRGRVPALEILCEHAPVLLEGKEQVRLSVSVCILPLSCRWWGGSVDTHRSTMQHAALAPLL